MRLQGTCLWALLLVPSSIYGRPLEQGQDLEKSQDLEKAEGQDLGNAQGLGKAREDPCFTECMFAGSWGFNGCYSGCVDQWGKTGKPYPGNVFFEAGSKACC